MYHEDQAEGGCHSFRIIKKADRDGFLYKQGGLTDRKITPNFSLGVNLMNFLLHVLKFRDRNTRGFRNLFQMNA